MLLERVRRRSRGFANIKWGTLALACLATLGAGGPSFASSTGTTKIGTVYVQYGSNIAMFTVTGTVSGWASCATTQRYAISLGTPGGQAAYATILTAKAGSMSLQIFGTGACDVWGDSETLSYVAIQN